MITVFNNNPYRSEASMYISGSPIVVSGSNWLEITNSTSTDVLTVSENDSLNYSMWIEPNWPNITPVTFMWTEVVPNKRPNQNNYYTSSIYIEYNIENFMDSINVRFRQQWEDDFVPKLYDEYYTFPVSGINQGITGLSPNPSGTGSWDSSYNDFVNLQVKYYNGFQNTGDNADNSVTVLWNDEELTEDRVNFLTASYYEGGVQQSPIPSNVGINLSWWDTGNVGSSPTKLEIGERWWQGYYWMDKFIFDNGTSGIWNNLTSSAIYGNGSPGTFTPPDTVVYYDFSSTPIWYTATSGNSASSVSSSLQVKNNPNIYPTQDRKNYVI